MKDFKTKKLEEIVKMKYWNMDQWKLSKDKLARIVYYIASLSPHNYWKGYEALLQLMTEVREKTREEAFDYQFIRREVLKEVREKIEKMKYEGQNVYLNEAITNILSSLSLLEKVTIESQDAICTIHGRKGCFHSLSEKKVAIICAGLCCSGLRSCTECKECSSEKKEDHVVGADKKINEKLT